ncbi:MAG: chromosomal replication initiator protein DnaA [Clostridia bacterium]|nr:MAG: chromosomal replication initiator protein DnaA [Clostridia bacterium]
MESIKEVWEGVERYLRTVDGMPQVVFDVWIAGIEPYAIKDGEMVVYVNTNYQRRIILENYAERIMTAFRHVLGVPLGLKIIAREVPAGDPQPEVVAAPETAVSFEENFTFDNFIVGSSNKFAYAASQAVATKPAVQYNPLFIYGGSGLGKTHLLYAICNEIRKNNPSAKILYTKAETMTNEIIEAMKNGTNVEFRSKYRQVDVLLVDDIQFLSGKERTQEEFFHTFDFLHSNNKQIILTSDRPPKEIATLEDRLRNRFEMGLMADIQPPDLETRIAIIRRKAESLDIPISDDIAEYIAGQLKSNVRQLEGVVKNMRAQYMLKGEKLSVLTAQNAIRDIRNDNQPVTVTVDRIISEVARSMMVKPEDIRSQKRSAPISQARQVAEYVMRNVTGLPMQSIGDEFGARDHSTIVYALRKVEERMEKDSVFKNTVNDIIKNISEN